MVTKQNISIVKWQIQKGKEWRKWILFSTFRITNLLISIGLQEIAGLPVKPLSQKQFGAWFRTVQTRNRQFKYQMTYVFDSFDSDVMGASYSHWLGKRRDMDQYICYSRRLLIDHIRNFVRIRVCIQYMDRQSIAANKHMRQHRYVLCTRHSLRMATVRMDSVAYRELLAALKIQFNDFWFNTKFRAKERERERNIQSSNGIGVIWWIKCGEYKIGSKLSNSLMNE